MRPALLVIDIQNAFLPYMAEQDQKIAPEIINVAIGFFRQRSLPIIRIYHTQADWGPKPDTPGFHFIASVKTSEEDRQIIKNYPNAFKQTGLEKLLRELGCDSLFLCGLSATGCVLATYYGAKDRDFGVFMIKDAILSHHAPYTKCIEDICDSVNLNTLKVMLDHLTK
jgi:nicotinamidase-related amidase